MKLLYSDMLPLALENGQQTFSDCFHEQFAEADSIDIAVGYVSNTALEELDLLIEKYNIKHILLVIGMYYIEGMPERTYHTVVKLNKKWIENNIGEIRIVCPLKFHGKLYCFSKNSSVFSAIMGSANLGALKLEASNRRQYEISALTENLDECKEIFDFIKKIEQPVCSTNISKIADMPLIREYNVSLTGIDAVEKVPPSALKLYETHKTDVSFILPIKVPSFADRFCDDSKHYTKSNINVCYAAPRNKRKSRDWYETQMTVSKEITTLKGYPEKNNPFFVLTDDGYWFKAHTTSDGNKQFSAVGDELIIGRWLKGRIASAGLVTPVNDTQKDKERSGMITKEMLNLYGCDSLVFTKTDQKALDGNEELDVWLLEFTSIKE